MLARLYSITFLRLRSEKISSANFFRYGAKNFGQFLEIGLVLLVLDGLLVIIPIPGMVAEQEGLTRVVILKLSTIYLNGVPFLTEFFLVFSYPLVVIGFFSKLKLKPVSNSILLVLRNFKKMGFIIRTPGISLFLVVFIGFLFPSGHLIPETMAKTVISASLTFLTVIYSYIVLTEYFFKGLNFELKRGKSE